jgi:hypothetical protein
VYADVSKCAVKMLELMKIVGLLEERIDAHYVAVILVEWAITGAGYGSLTYIHN